MQHLLQAIRVRMILIMGMSALFFLLLGITGCSQGEAGPAVLKPEGTYKTGFFIDSAVEGLQYKSITWSGITDSQGSFLYNDGEEITFSIGGVVLGSTLAKGIITPVDLDKLVQPNFSTKVINITRFLLSLDQDGNPGNGIIIPQSIRDALKEIRVNFSNPVLDNDAGVKKMFEVLNGSGIYPEEETRGLVSSEAAQLHLEDTLNQLAQAEAEAEDALSKLVLHASIDLPYSSILMIESQSINLLGSVIGGKSPYTYSWHVNDEKPFSTKQSPGSYSLKTKGSYLLSFTSKDTSDDTNTDIRHITVFGSETQEGQTDSDSIPTVTIISQLQGAIIKAGSTVDFQAIMSNGNLPLYYGWSIDTTPGNIYNPKDEAVICISPRTYMITQSITLNVPGTYDVSIAVKDTSVEDKTPDAHASGIRITVE